MHVQLIVRSLHESLQSCDVWSNYIQARTIHAMDTYQRTTRQFGKCGDIELYQQRLKLIKSGHS